MGERPLFRWKGLRVWVRDTGDADWGREKKKVQGTGGLTEKSGCDPAAVWVNGGRLWVRKLVGGTRAEGAGLAEEGRGEDGQEFV
jgi:hypothetical protein